MGNVYLGEDTVLDRQVPLKAIRHDGQPPSESRERLLQEARAVAPLKIHPHIATVLDVIEPSAPPNTSLEIYSRRSVT